MLVDTHAHLDFPEFVDDVQGTLDRAAEKGVMEVITIGIDEKSSEKAVSLAHSHGNVYASVGLHPHGAKELGDQELQRLKALAKRPKVVAMGEIGLDYYRDRQPRETQKACLRRQLDLAVELHLPVVFHVRNAYDDFLEIAESFASRLQPSVLHCFSGDWAVAERCLRLGWYLSVPGIVTFAKAEVLHDVVRQTPLERLLVETDAPFLAPVPFRGKPNEPAYVYYTAQRVAELKDVPFDQVAAATTANAHRVFSLQP